MYKWNIFQPNGPYKARHKVVNVNVDEPALSTVIFHVDETSFMYSNPMGPNLGPSTEMDLNIITAFIGLSSQGD